MFLCRQDTGNNEHGRTIAGSSAVQRSSTWSSQSPSARLGVCPQRWGVSHPQTLRRRDAHRLLVCCRELLPRSSFFGPLHLWTLPLNTPGVSASPGCLDTGRQSPLALSISAGFGLSSVPERCNGKTQPAAKSAIFWMRLFKQTFEEKEIQNAILKIEIRCFSDCSTSVNQRTVKWTAPGESDLEGSGAGVGLCDWFQERGGTPSPLLPCVNLKLFLSLSEKLPFWRKQHLSLPGGAADTPFCIGLASLMCARLDYQTEQTG